MCKPSPAENDGHILVPGVGRFSFGMLEDFYRPNIGWSGFAVKKLEMSHDPLWKYGCEPTHGSVLTRTVEIMIWRHISSYLIYVYIHITYFFLNPSITYPLSRYLYDNIYLTLTFEMPIP